MSTLGRRNVNWLFRVELPLVAQIISQIYVDWAQSVQHRDSRRLESNPLRLEAFGLAFLKVGSLAIGEAKLASPCALASLREAILALLSKVLASLLKASLTPLNDALVLAFSEVSLASLSASRTLAC